MHPDRPLKYGIAALLIVFFLGFTAQNSELFALFAFAHSGRVPTETVPTENSTIPTQITQPSESEPAPTDAVLSFSPADLSLVRLYDQCGAAPDLQALLADPALPALRGEAPTVLILHSHATEGYADTGHGANCRSTLETENMLAVGDEVKRVLELGGIRVIHDRSLHDHPDYNSAYANARESILSYLKKYPSIRLVLDLHRDASADGQMITAATVGGQRSAQLMIIACAGTPQWQENLSLALKLQILLEQADPGVTRPICLRSPRYNLDLTGGSLLIEVGSSGNAMQEAILAANALARAILELSGN